VKYENTSFKYNVPGTSAVELTYLRVRVFQTRGRDIWFSTTSRPLSNPTSLLSTCCRGLFSWGQWVSSLNVHLVPR